MPFRHQVFVKGSKLRGVGRTGRRHFPPDMLQTGLEGCVGDIHNGCTQLISMDVTTARGQQFLVAGVYPWLEQKVGIESWPKRATFRPLDESYNYTPPPNLPYRGGPHKTQTIWVFPPALQCRIYSTQT